MKARVNTNESLSAKYLGNSFTFSSIGQDTVHYMKRIANCLPSLFVKEVKIRQKACKQVLHENFERQNECSHVLALFFVGFENLHLPSSVQVLWLRIKTQNAIKVNCIR